MHHALRVRRGNRKIPWHAVSFHSKFMIWLVDHACFKAACSDRPTQDRATVLHLLILGRNVSVRLDLDIYWLRIHVFYLIECLCVSLVSLKLFHTNLIELFLRLDHLFSLDWFGLRGIFSIYSLSYSTFIFCCFNTRTFKSLNRFNVSESSFGFVFIHACFWRLFSILKRILACYQELSSATRWFMEASSVNLALGSPVSGIDELNSRLSVDW